MRLKYIVLTLFISAAVLMIALPACRYFKRLGGYHGFMQSEDFKKLSRADQVLKCAQCHKQEFENEVNGPHANAYKMLLAHREFVNSTAYDCGFYTRRVNKEFESCAGCHASQNLSQTILFDSAGNNDQVLMRMVNNEHPLPPARENLARPGGTDCLSCHYNGEDLVSLKHVFTAADSDVTKQNLKTIVANNLNCYICHADVVRSVDASFAIKTTGVVMCTNCHSETDKTGKGTHYYYWAHNTPGRVNPTDLRMMRDVTFSRVKGSNKGEIVWRNSIMPHDISECPEIIFNCQVMDKDSNVLGEKLIRINKKKEFDAIMYKHDENNNLPGEYGVSVPLDAKPLTYDIELKRPETAEFFKISMVHKGQYWFPDSLGSTIASKVVNCK